MPLPRNNTYDTTTGSNGAAAGARTTTSILKLVLAFVAGWIVCRSSLTTTLNIPSSSSSSAVKVNTTTDHRMAAVDAQLFDSTAVPIGSLGPKGTTREHFVYYDMLFLLALRYGRDAKSILEVGCATDPFVRYLSYIGGDTTSQKRTCVAPYFVNYENKKKEKQDQGQHDVELIEADFMKWDIPASQKNQQNQNQKYDLLICSQVVEHVPDPGAFMKKLIKSATTAIISVPYDWPDCGKKCNHISNHITLDTILEWTSPEYKPVHYAIVSERGTGKTKNTDKRIIAVFQS